jgi:hypothetical protein
MASNRNQLKSRAQIRIDSKNGLDAFVSVASLYFVAKMRFAYKSIVRAYQSAPSPA